MTRISNNNKRPPALRRLALFCVICLACLYLLTLLAAFFDHSADKGIFKFLLFCCLVLPVLIYVFLLFIKLKK